MIALPKTAACLAAMCLFVGCEQKEKVLDVETPEGELEIEKSDEGVEIEIKANDKTGESLNIKIPKDEDQPDPQ